MESAVPRDTDAELDRLLSGLNEPQRAAVLHGEGPLLILAGAGSGKTRVLTHRIAYLLATGQARPHEILAITFTNKAAQEMRERVELLVGARTRAMWLMTFHAACARMLRADAHRLGYTRQFTIYDQADARRLVKRCIDELDVDPKRFTPGAIHHEISDAKNKLRDADTYGQMVGSYFEQTVVDVYRLYESELHRMNAMDFDDLLVRAVNVMELFPEVSERYASAFRHVLVDEYQDTNHAQYRWLQLIGGAHRNICVVGDDDQCLVEGTQVTMGDGSARPIEAVRPGDEVLSCYGSGDMRPARVLRTHRSERAAGIRIVLHSGRELVSTPEHTHFADHRQDEVQVFPGIRGKVDAHRGGGGVALAERPASAEIPLPALLASAVRPGMAMFTATSGYDLVESVERIELDRPVYDLDVESTHNFVANGVITHNSVYGFRGADVRNILDFQDTFEDAYVVKLEQNYRSTQTILDAANAVIANNRGRMGKALWTDLGVGDPIKVRELEDEHAEARFVAGEIERLVDEGTSRNEVAVFYRTNAQSRVLEDTLVRAQIGYQVIGGTKFYERAEIKDAIAYLTVLVNPQDVVSFGRDRQLAAARDRRDVDVARDRLGEHGRHHDLGRGRRARVGARARDRGRQGVPPLHGHDESAARAGRVRRADRRAAERAAARDGLPRRAGGGAHDRGAGPDREPRGARERRGRVRLRDRLGRATRATSRRRSPASCSRSRSSRTPTRAETTRAS